LNLPHLSFMRVLLKLVVRAGACILLILLAMASMISNPP